MVYPVEAIGAMLRNDQTPYQTTLNAKQASQEQLFLGCDVTKAGRPDSPDFRKNVRKIFEEIIMRKLVFFALSSVATAAMAVLPAPGGTISISGTSSQTATLNGASVSITNSSNANNTAFQNLSSNFGTIAVGGSSTQVVTTANSGSYNVTNTAVNPNDVAVQNLSSNYFTVNVNGTSSQTTNLAQTATLANEANGSNSEAVQNFASNDSNGGVITITGAGASTQTVGVDNSVVNNTATGGPGSAQQNLSSNRGEVTINASSTQTTNLNASSLVENTANGTSKAIQNLASNNGTINVNGTSVQSVDSNGGVVRNSSTTGSFALQNLSSNKGEVTINASTQITFLSAGTVTTNSTLGSGSLAVQNIASNNTCVSIGSGTGCM